MTTGKGNELDRSTEPGEAESDQQQAGHDRCHREPIDAVLLYDTVDDHDEGARRSPDLHPRATQRGDDQAGDDRGIEAPVRGQATGNGERDGQRERYDTDDDAGGEVRRELAAVVGLESGDELRNEQGGSGDNALLVIASGLKARVAIRPVSCGIASGAEPALSPLLRSG